MLKTVALASAISLFAGMASAEDTAKPATIDWSGVYIGAQTGYAWGNSFGGAYVRATNAFIVGDKLDPDGFIGGIHVGYNHQFSNSILLGIEGDINYADMDSGTRDFGIVNNSGQAEMTWNGSIRARAGYAIDRVLPFVTAGYAFGRYEFNPNYAGTGPLPGSKVHSGWTIGAGLEYAFTENVSARIEYRYTDYGKARYDTPGFPADESRIKLMTNDVRIGLSYRF